MEAPQRREGGRGWAGRETRKDRRKKPSHSKKCLIWLGENVKQKDRQTEDG